MNRHRHLIRPVHGVIRLLGPRTLLTLLLSVATALSALPAATSHAALSAVSSCLVTRAVWACSRPRARASSATSLTAASVRTPVL